MAGWSRAVWSGDSASSGGRFWSSGASTVSRSSKQTMQVSAMVKREDFWMKDEGGVKKPARSKGDFMSHGW